MEVLTQNINRNHYMNSKLGNWKTGGKSVEQGGKAMPVVSAKQKKFMDAAAHNPTFAREVGVPSRVAKEYSRSSKGLKFSKGGEMKDSKGMMKKEVAFMKKKGAPKSMIKHEQAEAGMGDGGVTKKMPKATEMGSLGMKAGGLATFRSSANGIAARGKTKAKQVKMAAGGVAKKYC